MQYDYGLRGKRSRPIHKRPTSFVSAAGKIIQPEIATAEQNDIQTKQGLVGFFDLVNPFIAKVLDYFLGRTQRTRTRNQV